MLSTIRAYAAERLAERGEVDATIGRLARYLIGVVWAVRDDLQGPRHRAAADRLDRERDEILSAIGWALRSDDADTVGRLLTPLFTYWWSRGLLSMTHELAEEAAALPSAAGLSLYASALLLGARGMAMVMVGQNAEAEPLLRQAFETATELGNARLRAYALLGLAMTLVGRMPGEGQQSLDEAAEAFRALSDRWGLALAMSIRGHLALEAGDPVAARTLHLEGLAAAEAIDNDQLRAQLLDMLGLDAVGAGDFPGARERFGAAAELHIRLLDYEGSAYGLAGLAGLALAQHRPEVSARLIGASGHLRKVIDAAVWPGMQAADGARTAAVSRALGATAFGVGAAAGARMTIPDALAYGLTATNPD
jgi:tetratricopeptide (TPR) repeat protein